MELSVFLLRHLMCYTQNIFKILDYHPIFKYFFSLYAESKSRNRWPKPQLSKLFGCGDMVYCRFETFLTT